MITAQAAEDRPIVQRNGDFFGGNKFALERRRLGTVIANELSDLLKMPRKTVLKLLNDDTSVKHSLDEAFTCEHFSAIYFQVLILAPFGNLLERPGAAYASDRRVVFQQGDLGDAFYLIRNGVVKVSQRVEAKEAMINCLPVGCYFGEMTLLDTYDVTRSATVKRLCVQRSYR